MNRSRNFLDFSKGKSLAYRSLLESLLYNTGVVALLSISILCLQFNELLFRA